MSREPQPTGRTALIRGADCSARLDPSRLQDAGLLGLPDTKCRRSKTLPSTHPSGERRGQGLTELIPLKDAPDTMGALVDAQWRFDARTIWEEPRRAVRNAASSQVRASCLRPAHSSWLDQIRGSRPPADRSDNASEPKRLTQPGQAAIRSDTVAGPRQYSLRMSTTLIKRSPAANRAMFSL